MISFTELQNKADNLYPIVVMENFFSHRIRRVLKKIVLVISALLLLVVIITSTKEILNLLGAQTVQDLLNYKYQIRSAFVFTFSLWILFSLLEAFYYSVYFSSRNLTTFQLSQTLYFSDPDDLTAGFFKGHIGQTTLSRLGIDPETFVKFLSARKKFITNVDFEMPDDTDNVITTADYGMALFNLDSELQRFLNDRGINENEFIETIDWVRSVEWQKIDAGRWWTRERLAKIPSFGRNWAFGKVYLLEKYGHVIFEDKTYQSIGERYKIYEKYTEELQNVLLKSDGANAMIVGSTNDVGMNLVATLGKLLISGRINTALQDRRIFVLDGAAIIDSVKVKVEFEKTFTEVLIQANNAGNVLLVIPHLPQFIESAVTIGVDVAELLSEFLSSSRIQIIALTDERGYHQSIETNRNLMQHFERISIKQIDQNAAIYILEEEALKVEAVYDIFFTYRAIKTIAESATRYFSEGDYADKVLDLIEEITVKTLSERKVFVTEKEVNEVVALKTGIPQGAIGDDERKVLASLEELLHKRVIGQNTAIEAISKSIKRARSGIQNPNRPIGSFLFLGPTGVGKTETTKALAESFFGDEHKIVRFDTSEYNSFDAVTKLIGGSGAAAVGTLASKLRENPYGVLLLDEFEKADKKIHDLFLQIIDEGRFTDNRGEEINARNLIIIATSNAGSDLIYAASLNNQNIQKQRDTIINTIIERAIFKPELLNRFDGVILFHALKDDHIRQIAKLMLQKLDSRLSQKGIRIDIDENLLNYLVKVGSNPQFGARAMNRSIQDVVEGQIAEAMVDGRIKNGQLVKFVIDPQSEVLKIVV